MEHSFADKSSLTHQLNLNKWKRNYSEKRFDRRCWSIFSRIEISVDQYLVQVAILEEKIRSHNRFIQREPCIITVCKWQMISWIVFVRWLKGMTTLLESSTFSWNQLCVSASHTCKTWKLEVEGWNFNWEIVSIENRFSVEFNFQVLHYWMKLVNKSRLIFTAA